jgi:hypothetical protein
MSNTYTFISQVLHQHNTSEQESVVYSIDWVLTATDGNKTVQLTGSTAVPFVESADFIDIDHLTDAVIEKWIVDNTAADTLEIHYKNLDTQLALM